MGQRMTWEEMKKEYPDEWLLITDYEVDKYGEVAQGVVERHSPSMEAVAKPAALTKDRAFRYTGESTFRGFRDHAIHDDAI